MPVVYNHGACTITNSSTRCVNTPTGLAEQGGLAPCPTAQHRPPLPQPPLPTRAELVEEADGFRETWLRYFTRSEDEAALRHLSRLLHELILEFRPYLPKPLESDTRGELAAAGRDLRFLAGYLAAVAAERVTCEQADDDARLSELAERLAASVEQVAFEIEAELAGARA